MSHNYLKVHILTKAKERNETMWSKVWNSHKRTKLIKLHWTFNRSRILKDPWEWSWRAGWDKKPPDPELWGSSQGPGWSPETAGLRPDRPRPRVTYYGLGLHHVGPSLRGGHVQFWPTVGPGWRCRKYKCNFSFWAFSFKKRLSMQDTVVSVVSVCPRNLNKVWCLWFHTSNFWVQLQTNRHTVVRKSTKV